MLKASVALTTWALTESFLEESLAADEYTIMTTEDIRRHVQRGEMDLWHIHDDLRLVGAFVTRIERGGRGGAVMIIALGGSEMPRWIGEFSKLMSRFAKDRGCFYVMEMGRAGWTRVLSQVGWFPASSVMLRMAV
jgi:hypothetical protein